MNTFEKFNEEQLPFLQYIERRSITDDDYKKAKQIWTNVHIENTGEYHDLYLKADVLLLTDAL